MFFSGCEDLFACSPAESVRRLQNELNRVFNGAAWQGTAEYPALNIYSSAEGLVLTAELPGMNAADIDVSVVGRTLNLKGERKAEPLTDNQRYLRREREFGAFARTLELPFAVESEKIQANYKDGILKLLLPRAEKDKPRKIAVN